MSDKKRILVVDDEPDFAAIVQRNLEKEGFEVDVAYDGVEGMEKVADNPPDAIVLDVMMPEKDGYEMCSELKADEKYADIPVVMLTAVADHVASTRYSHADGMSMEADDYLPKPASADEITASIKSLLNME
ncbi:MAG: response regulator [Deltaproteobacteria bacterium]|nr:response regulator [Deltaproteobacteria bacterium]MBW1814194.1 response regulator [Deltaproteobacteria bacterium]MBW1848877.1 response regulator [Deltaproteobacteria bacterium]MBW1984390.1 response regulator [Deltaproteobacteria bacterium]MBW2182217.1 response regulator [Deltaproteobacteria bacterium]